MTVKGTIEEINDVLQYFRPGFPNQNLAALMTNECFYILNGVPVKIILMPKGDTDAAV